MKTVYRSVEKNPLAFLKAVMAVIIILAPAFTQGQNLIKNSDFSDGTNDWSSSCSMEINPEPVYGGTNNGNPVTEIDVERCLDQTICIFPGATYVFSFKAGRRTSGPTPPLVYINIKITGVTSGSTYLNQSKYYNNTTWHWIASSYPVTIPSNSTDKQIKLHIQSQNNNTTYGVLIDDIQLTPQTALSLNGTDLAVVNNNEGYSVSGLPSSGISYSWSFGSNSSPATSTSKTPTTKWTTEGLKSLSVTLRNSSCTIATLTKSVYVTGVLPVSFTSFSGALKDNKAALNFSTSSEVNNNYFIVERSADGRKYDSVGRVQAKNTPGAQTYSFVESNNSSLSYYRIRQVDFNGAYTFSSIVILKNEGSARELTLFPSQAISSIRYSVTLDQSSMATLQVYDIMGKQVISRSASLRTGVNEQVLDISSLNAGLYFFKLQYVATGTTAVKQFQKL